MRTRKIKLSGLKMGDKVDYHSIIGGPITSYGHTIIKCDPYILSEHTEVAFITDVRGCVATEALTRSEEAKN